MKRALCVTALMAALAVIAIAPPLTAASQRETIAQTDAGPQTPAQRGALTPQARGQLTRQFVNKWGNYVQRVYNVPVGVWAKRMVPNFVAADATNFRNALKRDTYEGAMAEFTGIGSRLSDTQAIDRLARVAPGQGSATAVAAKFGDLNQDLVYTPVQPCRIVDTRSTALGTIAASSTRSFISVNSANFTNQGGSATSCGTLGVSATAVALNVTAVGYPGTGHATVYPFGTTRPTAASVNYNAGTFATNNGIIAQIPNPLSSSDFTIWTAQTSHFVVDIVGYFAPPPATALDCTTATQAILNLAPGGRSFGTASCPAGYAPTGGGVGFSNNPVGVDMNASFRNGNGWFSLATNGSTETLNVFHYAECCRVPGR